MTPEATLAPPSIPDYDLLRLVGRGSYGDVWLARGITGLYRAVKIVWRERFDDFQPYEREFKGLREFAAVSLIEARQLALLHVGRNDAAGFFYYVMELADDAMTRSEIDPATYVPHTLKVVRERRGRVPAPQVIGLATDLARALAGLHSRGLVHRDVKPSNVIFVGGVPKLADIGLVAVATSAHTFVGTEGFVPPEGPGTPTADVFSLGKLVYEISTGLDRHEYPRLPANLGEFADRKQLLELNEIIIRACDANPSKRYVDATALLDDLLLLQAGRSMRRLRAAERSLSRAIRVGTILGLVAAIAGAGVYVERQRAEHENILRRAAEAERDDLARKTIYSAGLARAQRAIELGNYGQARSQLNELVPKKGDPDLRGFEWHMLKTEAEGDPAQVLQETGSAVEKIFFSPDDKWLAWQSADMHVTLWDVAARKSILTIEGMYNLGGFSADGQWLVGVDTRAGFQRWSVRTGAPDIQPASHINRPLAPSADGSGGICFTDSDDGIVPHALRIWDFARHTEVMSMPIATNSAEGHWDFYRAAISRDNRLCALALIAGRGFEAHWQLQVLDLAGRKKLWSEPFAYTPLSLALSPDSTRLAVLWSDSSAVELRDLSTGVVLWRQIVNPSRLETLAFSSDGSTLAIASRDATIHLLDASTGGALKTSYGHEGNVTALAWSSSGVLASASSSGNVRLWQDPLQPSRKLTKSEWDSSRLVDHGKVSISHDGRRVAVSHDSTHVSILTTDTLKLLVELPATASPVSFIDDDQALLALSPDGKMKKWRLDLPVPSSEEFVLFKDVSTANAILSANGRWLAAADTFGQIQIWDWPARKLVSEQQAHKGQAWAMAFSPDGEIFASTGYDKKIKVWETRTGLLRTTWVPNGNALNLTFSPRGEMIAAGLVQGSVELYALEAPAGKRVLRTNATKISSVLFSPDGSRFVCGAFNGLLQIYATNDWREVTTLMPTGANTGAATVNSMSFSADSRILAAYLMDGRLRVWRQ